DPHRLRRHRRSRGEARSRSFRRAMASARDERRGGIRTLAARYALATGTVARHGLSFAIIRSMTANAPRLGGKVAIVTGAGSGFGEGIARRFAEEGAKVVVNDIAEAAAKRVATDIERGGGAATAIVADISRDGDVKR